MTAQPLPVPRCADCGSTDLHEGPNDPPPWCCCKRCGSTDLIETEGLDQ